MRTPQLLEVCAESFGLGSIVENSLAASFPKGLPTGVPCWFVPVLERSSQLRDREISPVLHEQGWSLHCPKSTAEHGEQK